jgi:hypothetical protein
VYDDRSHWNFVRIGCRPSLQQCHLHI